MKEYIEREAVLECVREDGYGNEFDLGRWGSNEEFQELIKEIPAADVRPVVRGEWIKVRSHDGGVWKSIACSNCKYEPWFSSAEPLYHFCPNCGADMREEQT